MAGRRYKDFRSGDFNEELGILLLKGLAAVAPVPRPEDIGFDAVATLLLEGPKNFLIAANSFYIQLKSSADRKVKYLEHEVRWLESLKLPFFIGSVRKADSAIDLYAAHRLSQALIETKYEEIELVLDPEDKGDFGIDPKTEEVTEKHRRVNIGPPILSWSIQDLAKQEFTLRVCPYLKNYLEAEQRNIDYRGIRYLEVISWTTNEQPRCNHASMLYQQVSQDEILRVLRSMAPHIWALSTRAWLTKDRSLLEAVIKLIDSMRCSGFDPDPNGICHSKLTYWDQMTFPSDIMLAKKQSSEKGQ